MADPLTKLREARGMARQCKRIGESASRRNFVQFALYWRRVLRAEQ